MYRIYGEWTVYVAGLVLSGAVVALAGTFLARAADVVVERSGFGRLWVGMILLAGATCPSSPPTSRRRGGVLAIVLTALGLAAVLYRGERRFALVEFDSALVVLAYAASLWAVYRHGLG
jgi:hypothetical protein